MPWLIILLLLNSLMVSNQTTADEIVKVSVPTVNVKAGNHFDVNVLIEIKNEYHIQAHEVTDEFIIPTTLEINASKEFTIKKQVFPSSKKFKLKGTNKYLDVYDGKFEIRTVFTLQKEIQRKVHHLNGKLNYQACDSMRCLFPRNINFSIDVDVR
jgi:hypothetical protein